MPVKWKVVQKIKSMVESGARDIESMEHDVTISNGKQYNNFSYCFYFLLLWLRICIILFLSYAVYLTATRIKRCILRHILRISTAPRESCLRRICRRVNSISITAFAIIVEHFSKLRFTANIQINTLETQRRAQPKVRPLQEFRKSYRSENPSIQSHGSLQIRDTGDSTIRECEDPLSQNPEKSKRIQAFLGIEEPEGISVDREILNDSEIRYDLHVFELLFRNFWTFVGKLFDGTKLIPRCKS